MSTVLPDITRSEHTGENRCWPCTVANLLILAAGCLALALLSPVAGALVCVVGVAVIWMRGYLIPYTPVFAPRVAARLPFDPYDVSRRRDASPGRSASGTYSSTGVDREDRDGKSGNEREPGTLADATAEDGEEILATLVEAGVVRASEDEIVLDGTFEDRWHDEIRTLRSVSSEQLADAVQSVAPGDTVADVVTERDRTYLVLSDGTDDPGAESWLRRPVAIAETAAARALGNVEIDPWQRGVAAHALCIFLETCPACDSALEERPAGGCCGPPRTDAEGRPLQALVCLDCRTQFAEFD